ncbi:MAG: hypothetical protein ACOC2U_05320 [bacterium]
MKTKSSTKKLLACSIAAILLISIIPINALASEKNKRMNDSKAEYFRNNKSNNTS